MFEIGLGKDISCDCIGKKVTNIQTDRQTVPLFILISKIVAQELFYYEIEDKSS